MDKKLYNLCVRVLNEELLPAMGCTEPIAVAYCAALARDTLGAKPDRAEIFVSGNILKNVKSVIVPNTGGLKGVVSAAAAGIVAGVSEKKLECLSSVTGAQREEISVYKTQAAFSVEKSRSDSVFDIAIRVYHNENSAYVRIAERHTNVVKVTKNGNTLLDKECECQSNTDECTRDDLTVKKIYDFVSHADLSEITPLLERQIAYNSAIAEEGLKNDYGARVGKVLLKSFGNDVHNRARATAAAGSDARMNGCELPVVIVSGSGNQGITASVPLVVYAKELNAPHEKLLRALALSDLITIHLKTGIGRLSAYCGAVSAGCGAGAGICYLNGGELDDICHTLVNALAIDSGIVCDGAKSSCAAKIASAVEAGLIGMEMYASGSEFYGGDGILAADVEDTIKNVGDLARLGMKSTDEEIIRLMIKTV